MLGQKRKAVTLDQNSSNNCATSPNVQPKVEGESEGRSIKRRKTEGLFGTLYNFGQQAFSSVHQTLFGSKEKLTGIPLPDETIVHILKYLSPKALCITGATCRQLNRLANDEFIWNAFLEKLNIPKPSRNEGEEDAQAPPIHSKELFKELHQQCIGLATQYPTQLINIVGGIYALATLPSIGKRGVTKVWSREHEVDAIIKCVAEKGHIYSRYRVGEAMETTIPFISICAKDNTSENKDHPDYQIITAYAPIHEGKMGVMGHLYQLITPKKIDQMRNLRLLTEYFKWNGANFSFDSQSSNFSNSDQKDQEITEYLQALIFRKPCGLEPNSTVKTIEDGRSCLEVAPFPVSKP